MTDDHGTQMWPAPFFGRQMQEMGEEAVEQQMELFERFASGSGGFDGFSQLSAMSQNAAMFKTRVQSGGRISIPDAERETLDIEEGDIVQTVVIPVKRNRD